MPLPDAAVHAPLPSCTLYASSATAFHATVIPAGPFPVARKLDGAAGFVQNVERSALPPKIVPLYAVARTLYCLFGLSPVNRCEVPVADVSAL